MENQPLVSVIMPCYNMEKFIAYGIDSCLTSYRIRQHSASSNKLKASSDLWKVYRQNEKLPLFKALARFSSYAFNAIKKRL